MIIYQRRMFTINKPKMRENMPSNSNNILECENGDVHNENNVTEYDDKQIAEKTIDSICTSTQTKTIVPKISFLLSHNKATAESTIANDLLQYRNAIEVDDELYDNKKLNASNQAKPTDANDTDRDAYGQACHYTTDDDGPLDLSLSSGHRKHQDCSDTDSEDSNSIEDDKIAEKAAYKKNLIKRYRK